MENITNADYAHVKRVYKHFEIKNLGEYHILYVQISTLLLTDLIENFRNVCLEVYDLEPAHFFFCTRISMTISFKID